MSEVPPDIRRKLDPGARNAKKVRLLVPTAPKAASLAPEGPTRSQEASQQPMDPSTHQVRGEDGRRLYSLILTKVAPDARDKFRTIEAPETYFEIKKGGVGDRVAYSVELTDVEAVHAASDVADPDVNLHHIEPVTRAPEPSTTLSPGGDVFAYLSVSGTEAAAMQGSGVVVGVADSGISPWIRDNIFAGRIDAAASFSPIGDPFDDQTGHGSKMVPLAVPPHAHLKLAQTSDDVGNASAWVAAGINWLVDEGCDVLLIEAQDNFRTLVVDEAVARADSAGILVIAPAGNGGTDFSGDGEPISGSPAASPGAYTVTNYNHEIDAKNPSSRFGSFVWAASSGSPVYLHTPGGSAYLEVDGGTSAASAVATDLVARLMGSGRTKYQTINHIETVARKTGAPSTYEGVGVLQLKPGSTPPPVQVGDEWTEERQAELDALVANVNADPTAANTSALFAFIRRYSGQTIEELVGDSWEDLVASGTTATVTFNIASLDVDVTLTLGGELNTTSNCQFLPVPPPMSFDKNDFDMPEITLTSDEIWGDNLPEYYWNVTRHADVHVHLDDPEFVYLENHTWGGGPDDTLVAAIKFRGHSSRYNLPIQFPPVAPGEPTTGSRQEFYPYWRIRGRWTCKIEESFYHWKNVGGFGSPGSWNDQYRFFTHFPLMGFREVLRVENVDPGLKETTFTDPARHISEPISFGSVYDVTNTVAFLGFPTSMEVLESELAVAGPAGVSTNPGPSAEFRYTLPQRAIGEPAYRTPAQVGGGTAGRYEWRFINPAPPLIQPLFQGESVQIINGFGDLVQVGNRDQAWAQFLAEIDAYQAFAGPYDPVVELDEANMEVHVSFETDLNAMYLPMITCNHNFFSPQDKDRERDAVPYQGWTVNYGGYWHPSGWGPGNYRDTSAPYDDSIPYYQQPSEQTGGPFYTNRGDPHVGTWRPSYFANWLGDLSARVARDWPEDNANFAQSNLYEKPMPTIVGTYTPIIDAGVVERPPDGRPPPLTPVPDPLEPIPTPLTPASGGCINRIDGASLCAWNVPTDPLNPILPGDPLVPEIPDIESPEFPDPDIPEIPDITPPTVPVIRTRFPDFPPFDCKFPDLGNTGPCGPSPGMGGFGPGGRGPNGEPQLPGHTNVITAGPFAGQRGKQFDEKTCYTGPATEVIDELVGELGIDPTTVVVEEGCDAQVNRCFDAGTSKFDALWAVADMCGFQPFDPGDGVPTIADPITPLPTTWTYHELEDLFVLERVYSGEGFEVFYAITVFRARVIDNATGSVVSPYFKATVLTGSPFTDDPQNVSVIEVGPETSDAAAAALAQREAFKSIQKSFQVQVAVPYNPDHRLRHKLTVQRPSRGFQETFMITAIESDLSEDGFIHILTASMIPGAV